MPIFKPTRKTCSKCGSEWWEIVQAAQLRWDVRPIPQPTVVHYPHLEERVVYRCLMCGTWLFDETQSSEAVDA